MVEYICSCGLCNNVLYRNTKTGVYMLDYDEDKPLRPTLNWNWGKVSPNKGKPEYDFHICPTCRVGYHAYPVKDVRL